MSLLLAALLLLGSDPDPLRHPVPVELYQMPIVQAHSRCVTKTAPVLSADPAERRSSVDAVISACRLAMEARLDRGELSPRGAPLSAGKRRATEIALDRIEAQMRAALMNVEPLTARQVDLARPGVELSERSASDAPGVVVLDPVAPFWQLYVACVTRRINAGEPIGWSHHAEVARRAIAACGDEKAKLMAQSDTALANAPDYRDSEKRRAAIQSSFDGFDAMMINFPRPGAPDRPQGQQPRARTNDAQD
jgi:hypothetical protein